MEQIESVLKRCPLVEQIWVYGNSFESSLVAVVVPSEKALQAWASKQRVQGSYEVSSCSHFGAHMLPDICVQAEICVQTAVCTPSWPVGDCCAVCIWVFDSTAVFARGSQHMPSMVNRSAADVRVYVALSQELCALPEAKEHILEQLLAVGRAGKLKGFELVRAIHLGTRHWAAAAFRHCMA